MTQDDGGDSKSADPPSNTTAAHHGWRSMGGVLAVQTQNAFNDHLVKMIIVALARPVSEGVFGPDIASLLSIIILIGFIVFSPIAGFLADRYSKRSVIRSCLLAQVGIFAWIAASIHYQSPFGTIFGFTLLAIQSVFFSPGKFGIPKELVGSKGVGLAASLLQMLTMLAILGGMWVSGPWFDSLLAAGKSPWGAAFQPILVVGLLSLIPLLLIRIVRPTPAAHPGNPFRLSILWSQFKDLTALFTPKNLRLASLGVAFFWGMSTFVSVAIVDIAYDLFPNTPAAPDSDGSTKPLPGAISEASRLSVSLGIGVLIGSLLSSLASRRYIELGVVPIGGLGIVAGLVWISFSTPGTTGLYLALGSVGMAGAIFMIPLNAYLQEHADPKKRGQIMAAVNLVDCLAGVIAVILYQILKALGIPPLTQFLILAGPALLIALYVFRLLPQNFFRFVILMVIRRIYHIEPAHHDRIPPTGGVLLVANHMTYIDAFVISAACDRPVRFVIFDHYYNVWWMRWFLKLLGTVPISATKAKAAIRTTADAIKKGEIVCIFPEGQISRTGMPNEIKNGFALIARNAKCPVVPAFMDSLWGSIFSYESAKYFKKRPLKIPYHVRVNFGHPIEPKSANAADLRDTLTALGEEAFRARDEIRGGLPRAITRSLARKGRTPAVIDARIQSRTTKRRSVIAVARRLAKAWEDDFKNETRIGVLLPNSGAATMIHSGLILAGKIPVNLPLDPGTDPDALRATLESAGIRTLITAKAFRDSIKNYPWPENVREVGPEIKRAASGLFLESLKLTWLPTAFLLPKRITDPDSEAVAWISHRTPPETSAEKSKSEDTFQLQSLSHAALVANAHQIANANIFRRSDRILTCTDASSFAGVLCGLWHPILHGIPAVNLPLAAKAETLALFAEAAGANVGVADSHRRARAAAPGLRATYLIAPLGDPETSATQNRADQGIYPLAALTNPHSLVAASIPHPSIESDTADHQNGWIENSPGHLLPGIAIRQSGSGNLKIKAASLGTEEWIPLNPEFTIDDDGFLQFKLG